MSSNNPEGEATIGRPEELIRLKHEISERWQQLPPEHQASMLLVLLDESPEGDWSAQAHLFRKEKEAMIWLKKEQAVSPRHSESYHDDEIRVDIITDETMPEINIGIKPGTEIGLLAFFKEKIVTDEPIYTCVVDGGGIFPQPVSIDWSQPIKLVWKKKEGAMGRIFREGISPEQVNSLTFLQREDGGLTVIYYWPQAFFDEGWGAEHYPASEIAMLEFFFSYPDYMVGRQGFPNGVLVQWARDEGGDLRIRPPDPEDAITTFK